MAVIRPLPAAAAASAAWCPPASAAAASTLIDPALIPLVQYEIAYREIGAVIHTERLWTNLLTSQALAFNLFGPLKQR
ncbi:MAG: hypothetical protein ACJ8AW_39075, partial [Rhodopila sp.]